MNKLNYCNYCKKNIISNEYIVHMNNKICIFCINNFKKLNIYKHNDNYFLEFRLQKINKIALVGKICSGKTFVANYLVNNYKFTKYSFADSLKKIAKDYYGMKKKDRKLLQDLSIKMKEIDKNVFVNYLIKKINKYDNLVIDDLRFENELIELKKRNFKIIKLKISKINQLNRYNNLYGEECIDRLNHISEIEQDNFKNEDIDYTIESNENILDEIDNIMKN